MKIKLALEWFINPDHLPFIVGLDKGLYKKNNIDLQIIEPEGHYDGFKELAQNNIQLATNEPLHLIEKYQNNICSIGNFFETNGGIIFTTKGYENLFNGKEIFRKVSIDNGIISISDFSKDVQIKPYDNWGEQKNGAKFEFSEGYKRLI